MKMAEWAEYDHRLAIIDLGTNSVRFDVYAVNGKGEPERLHREKRMIRLGEGLFKSGRIDPRAEARLHHALADFGRMIRAWGVDRVSAFATSALRESKPAARARLLAEIKSRHKISLKVISGAREAALIAKGILKNEKLPPGNFAIIDIGGGSTELIMARGSAVKSAQSLPLGALRLRQLFLTHQPPRSLDLLALRARLEETLPKKLPQAETVIGASGTIRCLARMAALSRHSFSPKFVRDLNLKMAGLDSKGLLKLPGMEEKRADLILAGSLLFEELLTRLGARRLISTSFCLRDGALVEALQKLKKR